MYAAYRLMGNFPSRGFGDSLSSAEFTSGASIVSGTDARLPMSGVTRTRSPQSPGEVTEAYHAYEIHPLSFGQLAVLYSATGTMMQANGASTRPCTYTNAVTWAGADVPASVTADADMCSMLRYNDFVTLQELWVLPKDANILPTKEWVEDRALRLEYAPPAPFSDAMLRSLLAHYWRTATLQFFGPWDSGKRMNCRYQDDLLLQHISNRSRNFTVCISAEDDCQALVPQAKGFLWQMALCKLPPQVRNITSMAAGVPFQHARSLYRDAAMCVVYPTPEASFDFTCGKFPPLAEDEDRFMQQMLQGNQGELLKRMHARYAAGTGKYGIDECSFMADYDLALALFRLERATDVWALMTLWYEVQQHLTQRHEVRDDLLAQVMQDVDDDVAARLKNREAEAAQLLVNQKDKASMLTATRLQSFLWEKVLYSAGKGGAVPACIVRICQDNDGVFFTELPAAQELPVSELAAQRMAALVLEVQRGRRMAVKLTNQQVQQLLRITPIYRQNRQLSEAISIFLTEYQNRHPDDRIRLLQLSSQYLDVDSVAAEAFKMLGTRTETPITEEEGRAIGSVWPLLTDTRQVQAALADYIAKLYERYFDSLSMVNSIANMLKVDTTDALVYVFTQRPASELRLHEQNFHHVLGQNNAAACLLAHAHNLPAVDAAYRQYLVQQLQDSVRHGESLYGWIVTIINLSLKTRLYARMQDRDDFLTWCTRLVLEYTLDYAKNIRQLPAEESFSRVLKLATTGDRVFAEHNTQVLEAYEALLQAGAPNAERQAQQLAPYLTGIRLGSRMQQVTSTYISALLQNELQKDHFWPVMNRKDIVQQIQRAGVAPSQIFDPATRSVAMQTIHGELAPLTQPMQYQMLYEEYRSEEGRFLRNFGSAYQGDQTIRNMWKSALQQAFMERFDGFYQACQSIDEARRLMGVADHIGMRLRVNESAAGKIIIRLGELQDFVSTLPDERSLFARVVEKANILRGAQSEKALSLMREECSGLMEQERIFMRLAALSLMHSVVFNGYNWRSFLRMLAPEMDDMMHNPYAHGSLPLLAVISGVLRLFERTQTADNLLQSFVHFLKRDANMAAYTAAVRKDQKAMALYFPGLENSGSLMAWLQD